MFRALVCRGFACLFDRAPKRTGRKSIAARCLAVATLFPCAINCVAAGVSDAHDIGGRQTPAPISIPYLASRDYVSSIQQVRLLGEYQGYRSYAVQYDSDGLSLWAVMNVPLGPSPKGGFPVIVMSHGNVLASGHDPFRSYYSTDQDSDAYRELVRFNPLVRFAQEGFIVFQPDYRGHGLSETFGKHGGSWQLDRNGERVLNRLGEPVPRVLDDDGLRFNGWLYTAYYTIDVLNLIAAIPTLVEAQAGVSMNLNNLFAWGRSLGGDVTARVIACSDRIRAASLWAPATTSLWDQAHFYQYDAPGYADGFSMEALFVELQTYNRIHGTHLRARDLNPSNFVETIRAPTLIQLSVNDTGVRSAWGIEFHYELLEHGVPSGLRMYPGSDHVFTGEIYEQAVQADLAFFRDRMGQGAQAGR